MKSHKEYKDMSLNELISEIQGKINISRSFDDQCDKVSKMYLELPKDSQLVLYYYFREYKLDEKDISTLSSMFQLVLPVLMTLISGAFVALNFISAPAIIQYYNFMLEHFEYSNYVTESISNSQEFVLGIMFILSALVFVGVLVYVVDFIVIYYKNKTIRKMAIIAAIIRTINENENAFSRNE